MSSHFYKYPIQVARLMQAPKAPVQPGSPVGADAPHEHPTCSLGNSIAQFLHLLLHTRLGQLRSAADFGCALWDVEFDNTFDLAGWEETLTRSLLQAVHQHETRLRDVRIRVSISTIEQPKGWAARSSARWHAHINIKGMVLLTHEAFSYTTQLQIGQLAT
jgi:phage baseplate assembly protein W